MMQKEKDFYSILDECLEQVLPGHKTVEQCLAEHPDEAAELEPLLRTALAAKEATTIKPSAEFRERARYRFQAAIREMEPQPKPGFFGWQPRWATALVVVLVLLLASGGTVAAASDSMPDETLYPVKLATETVRLRLAFSPMGKAELYVKLADERVAEIIEMANKGKSERVQQTAHRLNEQLIAMAGLHIGDGEAGGEAMVAFEAPQMQMAAEEAPASVPRAAPVPTPAPAPMEAPAPAVTTAPAAEEAPRQMRNGRMKESRDAAASEEAAPVLVAPGAPGWAGGGQGDASSKQAKLRRNLAMRAEENREALRRVLEQVPESVRPSLERAIEMADAGYEEAIRNLD